MIEKLTYQYLNTKLSVPAYLRVPDSSLPSKYILIEKVGGGEENLIKNSRIAIQSYADSLEEAMSLNEDVKTAMEEFTTIATIASCRLDTDYNFTDTTKKKFRYQAVFNVNHYQEVNNEQ